MTQIYVELAKKWLSSGRMDDAVEDYPPLDEMTDDELSEEAIEAWGLGLKEVDGDFVDDDTFDAEELVKAFCDIRSKT